MNNMKSKDAEKALRDLSLSIGDFIRYWGFRRIHGAIWAQLYLSPVPLSGTELARRLKLSKSLVSPALSELEGYRLIRRVDSGDEKTILFESEPEVNDVIKHVLKNRESKMLEKIVDNFGRFERQSGASEVVDAARVKKLRQMIFSAQLMLAMMLEEDQILDLPLRLEM